MKTHTRQFKQNLIKMGRQIKSQVIYGNTTLEDELFSVRYNVHTNLLKSAMKELEITSSVIIPENTVIKYKLGLLVGNSYEYLDYGNYVVYKVEELKDENRYRILCYDKMLYAMKDYENMNITYPIKVRNFINTICSQIGLTFANLNDTFVNYDKEIQNELYLTTDGDSLGYTYRDVLDELAEVTASIICINEATDKLEIRYLNTTSDTIDEEYIKDVNVKFGEKYGAINTIVLSRSQGTDNIYYPEILPQNPVELKIEDNQIMNWDDRNTYMPAIYNQLNGLEYYINDFESIGILYYEIGDKYSVTIGDNTYNCVLLNDEIEITQGLKENIYTDMPEQSVTDYTKADKTDLKTNLIVDKQNGKIQSIVDEIGDRSQKTTTITQDIDGIESKVDELEDLTNTISELKTITITDGYAGSDILELHIYGNNSVFNYLYPRNDLYPDDTLLPYGDSKIRFYNSVEDRTIDLGIKDVLRQNGDTRDEVAIDYTGKVTLIRRINTDGTVKLTPVITELGTLHFTLQEGNNTFEIINYTAPISVKYATKSTYTDIFATKVEMSSSISQTATEINLEVSKKVDESEVISKINKSAEEIQIEANKISLARKTNKFNRR